MAFSDGWESTKNALDGFFGSVLSGVSEGAGKVASQVIPVWTAEQMGVQTTDQLRNDTFNPYYAGTSLNRYNTGDTQNVLWDTNYTQQNTSVWFLLLLAGLAVVAGVVVGQKF